MAELQKKINFVGELISDFDVHSLESHNAIKSPSCAQQGLRSTAKGLPGLMSCKQF